MPHGRIRKTGAKESKPFPTLGQRLAAAIISYQLGQAGVDGTLKQYVGGNLHPWWEEKALDIYKQAIRNREAHPLAVQREPNT